MSGILWIIIVGFVAGIIARLLSPGPNNPSGFILTTVLGIAGAFLATFIGQAIGHYGPDQGAGFITATIGALVVLFIWNRLVASRVISDPGNKMTAQPSSQARLRTGCELRSKIPDRIARHGACRSDCHRARIPASEATWIASAAFSRNSTSKFRCIPGVHPHQFAGHVARRRRGEKAHQLRDIVRR